MSKVEGRGDCRALVGAQMARTQMVVTGVLAGRTLSPQMLSAIYDSM